jgi:hypothetical protein
MENDIPGASRVDQVVECLLTKHKALSSNPSIEKKKKENYIPSKYNFGNYIPKANRSTRSTYSHI